MAVVVLALQLGGCAKLQDWEPARDAVRSTAPNGKGYVIAGLADENAPTGLLEHFGNLKLTLSREDGYETAFVDRYPCNVLAQTQHDDTCGREKLLDWRVVTVSPGDWTITNVAETFVVADFPARRVTISVPFPSGTHFHVGPGEAIYIGDFLFSNDLETQKVLLKTYSRNDAAAARVLAGYPGLQGPIAYRDPAARR